MGNCAKYTNITKPNQTQPAIILHKFNQQPQDTQSYANKNLPTLDIRPMLRKVKVKNSPQKKIGVRFVVCGDDQVLLPEKAKDDANAVKWEVQENFQLSITEYQLRKKFLVIELISNNIVLSTLKINMYLIMVGPYHLDFEFPLNDTVRPRISFDFKMSQVVSLRIQTESLQVYQMKQYVGQEYAFSLKSIFGNNPKVSELSKVYKIQHQQPEDNIPIAVWNKSSQAALPHISGLVPFYQFHYATLKYIFYKIDKINPKQSQKPIAQCFISFVKLLGFDQTTTIHKDKTQYQVKNIKLQEKLWYGGKQCGRAKINIKFQIQKHLKQMLVCVRTQNGIVKSSPVYNTGLTSSKQINKQITELQNISQKLMNQQGQLQKRRNKAKKEGEMIGSMTGLTKQSYKTIEKCLQDQIKVLQRSVKQTIKIYDYAKEQDLHKGQYFLIKIGQRQLRYINEDGDDYLEDLKWKVLRTLIERGQFTLSYIGFDLNERNSNKQPSFLARKKDIGLKFQNFNYRLLQLTVKALAIKSANQQKRFAQQFCAYAYFRIPQFRQKILSLINKKDDPQIQQWRGTDFSLKNTNTDLKTFLPGQNTFQILFNWQKYFHSHLKNQSQYQSNLHILDNAFGNKQWETRISRRRGAFFAFIRQWVSYVSKISVRIVHSNWKHFPGYIQIISCLMAQMKIRQVSQYPSSIKMACNSLLYNQNLLNIFVTIIFNKTNLNNNFDVIKILDLTNGFFHAIKKQNKRIPSTFNYNFFYNGVKLVIQNLYSYSTAKALHLLYQQFDFFVYEFRIQLCNYLLGHIFFKLFLHWSYNVRVIFHHLAIVKIYKFFANQLKVQNLDPETRLAIRNISGRYSQLLIILQNVKKIKGKRFVPTYQDQLYKKLRNNLRKKKKIQRKGQDSKMLQQRVLDQIPDTNIIDQKDQKLKSQTAKIMTQLARPQLQRYDSQVITKDIRIALSETPIKQKDQVIRKRVANTNYQLPLLPSLPDQVQISDLKKKARVSMNTADELQMPVLSQQDIKYVNSAMNEFNLVSNDYLESIKKKKGDPLLKMEIMLDTSQMKPQQFNDIQQW